MQLGPMPESPDMNTLLYSIKPRHLEGTASKGIRIECYIILSILHFYMSRIYRLVSLILKSRGLANIEFFSFNSSSGFTSSIYPQSAMFPLPSNPNENERQTYLKTPHPHRNQLIHLHQRHVPPQTQMVPRSKPQHAPPHLLRPSLVL